METQCSVEGCGREILCRSFCELHYQRWRKWGDPTKTLLPRDRVCTIKDCGRRHEANGLCERHYQQHRRSTVASYRESRKASYNKWLKKPGVKEREAARVKAYYWDNRDACRDRCKSYSKQNREKITRRARAYNQTLKRRFANSQREAARRDLSWDISPEFFAANAALPCSYCGAAPTQRGGTWMDRVDCSQGYSESNVVPCCRSCNMFRSDLLSQEETVAAVALIKQLRGGRVWDKA